MNTAPKTLRCPAKPLSPVRRPNPIPVLVTLSTWHVDGVRVLAETEQDARRILYTR